MDDVLPTFITSHKADLKVRPFVNETNFHTLSGTGKSKLVFQGTYDIKVIINIMVLHNSPIFLHSSIFAHRADLSTAE